MPHQEFQPPSARNLSRVHTADDAPRRSPARWFANRPMAVKVGASVLCGLVVAAFVGWMGLTRMADLHDASNVQQEGATAMGSLTTARAAFLTTRLDAYGILFATGPTRPAAVQKLQDDDAVLDAALADLAVSGAAVAEGDVLPGLIGQYRDARAQGLLQAAEAGDVVSFTSHLPSVKDLGIQTLDAFAAAVAAEDHLVAGKHIRADAEFRSARTTMAVSLAAGVLLAALVGIAVSRAVTRPLARVRSALVALADGDLTTRTGLDQHDEVGQAARALDTAVAALREVMTSVVSSADAVAASSEELSASAAQISAGAEETSAQSGVVSSAAEEVSRSVQTVAAGAEEMGASIREIASNAAEASAVAARAVTAAENTTATVAKLGDSSAEIGNVVKVITSIAEQTNLLALNATIEAARAGEAGKGFAVVANEVKELAQETAKATEDIARRVQSIQGDTTAAVAAIEEISSIVAQISDRQTTIASAVEEQTATTSEMSRSVQEAAGGTTEIASNITGVSTAAESTTQALTQTRTAVDELSRMAADLRSSVATFTY